MEVRLGRARSVPRVSRRAAPGPRLSSKSALAPRFRPPRGRPCQRLEFGRYHSPPTPPTLVARVQGGVARWTFKVPPWTRYLGKVPWQGGTWHVDLAFTITYSGLTETGHAECERRGQRRRGVASSNKVATTLASYDCRTKWGRRLTDTETLQFSSQFR